MQSEKGYLYEVSQLMYAIIESDDIETMLRARYTLDTHVYPRMVDYGFTSKEELRDSVHYWRAQQPDPTKELRVERMERWKNGGMRPPEKEAFDKVQSGGSFKEYGGSNGILKSMWSKYLGKDQGTYDDLERD
jgi:hypothetical protein